MRKVARRRTRPIRARCVLGLSFGSLAIQRSTRDLGRSAASNPCSWRNRSSRCSDSLSAEYLYPQACFSAMNSLIHGARALWKVNGRAVLFMEHLRVQRGTAQRFDIDLGVDLGRLQRKVPQDPRDGLQRGPDLQQARGHRMAERVQPLPGLGGQDNPRPPAVEGQDVMEVIRVAERLDRGLQP